MLEFYATLQIYLFFLASQWFHTFKSFSNVHFLSLAYFTAEIFWDRILIYLTFLEDMLRVCHWQKGGSIKPFEFPSALHFNHNHNNSVYKKKLTNKYTKKLGILK